jgi:ABC-type uncharacterized transport system substrate-binding protein
LQRLAILARLDNPSNVVEANEVTAAARTLGIEVATSNIRRTEDIAPALEALKGRADALHVVSDPLLLANGVRINTLAIGARLPTMYSFREGIEAGALMSYGANFPNLWRRAAELVGKILRGGRAADQVRPGHQHDHGEGARPRDPGDPARPRRRGDRMIEPDHMHP